MDVWNVFQSKKIKIILSVIIVLIIMLLIFQAGIFIGYRKAAFSYQWGDNYYRALGGRHGGPMMFGFPVDRDFSSSHGTIGKILKINLPILIFEDKDGIEKVVVLDDDTTIMRFRDKIVATDLKIGDVAVVIGSPDDNANIDAKLIRLLPLPPGSLMGTTTKSQ